MIEIKLIDEQEVLGKEFKMYGDIANPLFLAKNVAEWIEHRNISHMMKMVDDDEKLTYTLCNSGQNREMWFLTENGLYEVLMQSRKPKAKAFKKEVKAILKQIRMTGGYIPFSDEDTENTINAKASQLAQKTIAHYVELEKSLREKVAFAERILKSDENILIRMFAKLLSGNNFTIGETDLFTWFKTRKYLMKNNEPYQKYIDLGVLVYAEREFPTDHGLRLEYTTLVTPKGQQYFFDRLQEDIDNGKFSI